MIEGDNNKYKGCEGCEQLKFPLTDAWQACIANGIGYSVNQSTVRCDKYKTKGNKMSHRMRDNSEAAEMMRSIIEVLDEDRVLEFLVDNMEDSEKLDLAIELREQVSLDRSRDNITQTLEDLLMYIEKFGEGNSSEDMRIRQLDCIWKLSGGKDGV